MFSLSYFVEMHLGHCSLISCNLRASWSHCSDHLKPTMGDIELLRIFSLADEFKYMVVRDEEKVGVYIRTAHTACHLYFCPSYAL
jgi:hypothetical protein